jgi:transposase-like protein
MGQILHGSVRTTEAIRRAIQQSQASIRALAERHGINPKTVAKWMKRSSAGGARTGAKANDALAFQTDCAAWCDQGQIRVPLMLASVIALAATFALLANMALRWIRGADAALPIATGGIRFYAYGFLAGALIANSIPHFVHGISGEYFPAPFAFALGRGPLTNVVNVIWALFNFGLGSFHISRFRSTTSRARLHLVASLGFVTMSLFLGVVFSGGAASR